ncbi:RES family NAD+ phosphorylase [Aestuariibius insulae]|uniref:RES family NAD+ phosphorylase n=1 Tax=Aestuariibius insulae TaxID=2058287 RepID=UPI00345EA104
MRAEVKDRPPARFNRAGQNALYLSPNEESARVALRSYEIGESPERVLLTYQLETCTLFDLRGPEASDLYARARQPWRVALEAGEEPPSWAAADEIQAAGYVGLIDPSRQKSGLWHVAIFRWNEPGAPGIRAVGQPIPIVLRPEA